MRASLRGALGIATLAVALLASGCGGGDSRAIRIGVLSDCAGFLAAFNDLVLAASELPLLERGAKLAGRKPSDGVERARIAGKPVELLTGCTAFGDYRLLIAEARRLVEKEGVDILIGPMAESDGLVLREVARRHTDVPFVLALSRTQETTLRDPAPNVFRFQLDSAQAAAGLGSYAFHELGWRTAAIVAEDFPSGWPRAAGFVAEFCALGGKVVSRRWAAVGTLPAEFVQEIPRDVDGVALIPAEAFLDWSGFVRAYAKVHPDVARRLVLGPEALILPSNRAHAARLAPGVVGGDFAPYDSRNPIWLRVKREFARRFPGLVPGRSAPAEFPLVVSYRNAMEAVVEGLERVDGDPARLMAALARVQLDGPAGRIRLDANHQAIAPAYLTKIERNAKGKPAPRTVRVVPNVEQTFGGYFSPTSPPPTTESPACKKTTPPTWAQVVTRRSVRASK